MVIGAVVIALLAVVFLLIHPFLRRFLDDEEREPILFDAENGADASENISPESDDRRGFEILLNAPQQGTVRSISHRCNIVQSKPEDDFSSV